MFDLQDHDLSAAERREQILSALRAAHNAAVEEGVDLSKSACLATADLCAKSIAKLDDHESLRKLLRSCLVTFDNMGLERTLKWWQLPFVSRWPIHHEPLRNDARHLAKRIRSALLAIQDVLDEQPTPDHDATATVAEDADRNPSTGVGPHDEDEVERVARAMFDARTHFLEGSIFWNDEVEAGRAEERYVARAALEALDAIRAGRVE